LEAQTNRAYIIFGCTSNMQLRILHRVKDSLIKLFPHIPPTIKESDHLPTIPYDCSNCIMLQPISWLLSWQASGCTPPKTKSELDQSKYFFGKITVDQEVFCILRLPTAERAQGVVHHTSASKIVYCQIFPVHRRPSKILDLWLSPSFPRLLSLERWMRALKLDLVG
jgi:hypothetical protein